MTPRLTRDERRQQTREQLLDAAAQVFAEQGFQGASLDVIADRAGYTKGAVYSNFSSKDELFLAVVDRRTEEQMAKVERLFAAEDDPDDPADLLAKLKRSAEEVSDLDWQISVLTVEFWLYALRVPAVRQQMADRYTRLRERFGGLLAQRYEQEGQAPPMPPADLATLVLAVDTGLFFQIAVDPDLDVHDLSAKAMIRLLEP